MVMPPAAAGAVPADPAIAATALRTIPPREQGGNVDIKQLTAGTRLFLPVDTPGGLFSAGDAHFAQGDGEVCGTAIEMRATARVRFSVHSDRSITEPQFARTDYWVAPEFAAPRRCYATTGRGVGPDGTVHPEDATLAARNALRQMIEHLQGRGWSRQQAYAICSVAVDLRVSQLVDVPHFLVTALLPEDIFTG
jgi:formamidase